MLIIIKTNKHLNMGQTIKNTLYKKCTYSSLEKNKIANMQNSCGGFKLNISKFQIHFKFD